MTDKANINIIGQEYSDPDGEWLVTEEQGNWVTVKCVQMRNPNYGKLFEVPKTEAVYFINGGV